VERVNIADTTEHRDQSAAALYEVEDALAGLGSIDPKLRTVVEMKVFEGLTGDQIAERIGCSRRTVGNCWNFARRWLQKEWAGAEAAL
jgi:RNA polymerase sigma factor (sigma-70 family)